MKALLLTPVGASLASHALAWAALLWLATWPNFYQGEAATAINTPSTDGAPPVQTNIDTEKLRASLIDVNGRGVLIVLAFPVVLTLAGVRGAMTRRSRPTISLIYLWVSALVLLMFCVTAIGSMGGFYVPALLALLVAAVTGSRRRRHVAA